MRLCCVLPVATRAGLLACLLASSMAAQTVLPVDRGNYRTDGLHVPSLTSLLVGQQIGLVFRNFLVFDLGGVEGEITAASLRLDLTSDSSAPEFASPEGSETYELYDLTSDIPSLLAGTGGMAAFDDLGSGTTYGSVVVTEADVGTTVVIELNAAAIAAMNAGPGLFGLGGALTTIDSPFAFEFAFGGSVPFEGTVLEVTTAPPECLLLVGQAPGASNFFALDHVFDTQLRAVEASYPTLMESLPAFALPSLGNELTASPSLGLRSGAAPGKAAVTPRWLLDGEAVVQVVMWNPGVFPALPEQCSAGLAVQLLPDGQVVTTPFGDSVGDIAIHAEVTTTAQGQQALRFPFTVGGL